MCRFAKRGFVNFDFGKPGFGITFQGVGMSDGSGQTESSLGSQTGTAGTGHAI